jgi:protein O-mannosyl-transferase
LKARHRGGAAAQAAQRAGMARASGSTYVSRGRISPFLAWNDWVVATVLVAAVFATYSPCWNADFMWDDDWHLTENPCIVGPLGLKELWTTREAKICPLVQTTFWLEHAVWGLRPLPYHLVNILLYASGALVLWRVLHKLGVPAAALGAALWALHPVQVESVAWITELKNIQSGFFYLLSMLFFVNFVLSQREAASSGRSVYWYWASVGCAALALASKSATVFLPLALALCAWWLEGRWQWRRAWNLLPFVPLAAAACALSIWTQRVDVAHVQSLGVRSWPERIIVAGKVVWFYLGKLAWPHPLIFVYPRWKIDETSWLSYGPTAAVILVLAVLWGFRRTWARGAFFAFAYFLAALVPVLGLVNHYFIRYSFVGDHFQYYAGMGLLALTGAALRLLAARVGIGQAGRSALCLPLLLLLAVLSWRQCWMYKDSEAIFAATVERNPECWLAHNNLGVLCFESGRRDDATSQYRKALEVDPKSAETHDNLGLLYAGRGQLDDAIGEFRKAMELDPRNFKSHNNLGNLYARRGKFDDALREYRKALEIKPEFADAHSNLGILYAGRGQLDDAISEFRKALEIDPKSAETHNNLGLVHERRGQVDQAIGEYRKAVEIESGSVDAHNNLGILYAERGQIDDAISEFRKVLEVKPKSAETHNNLGLVYAGCGRLDDAVGEYRKALEINPESAETHNNLGLVLSRLNLLDEAVVQFQRALAIKPDYTDARRNLANARSSLNRPSGGGRSQQASP